MKKFILLGAMSLLLLCLMCACSKSDDPDLPVLPDDNVSKEDTTSVPTTPADGVWINIPTRQTVSMADYKKYVVGHGWREVQTYETNDDVTQYKDVPWRASGWMPSRYVIGDETITGFHYIDHVPALAYCDYLMRYDEASNLIMVGNNDKFTLLSVDSREIHAIEKGGLTSDHAGGMKNVFRYVVLQLMTDKEIQETRDTYWVNVNDIFRAMTREDLIHKWVLLSYSDNHIATHVSNDRNNDKAYILFFDDGTFTVKDGVGATPYKGTFEVEFYNDRNATINLKFDGDSPSGSFFLKNISQSKELDLTAAAYLTIAVDEDTAFNFQRSPSD